VREHIKKRKTANSLSSSRSSLTLVRAIFLFAPLCVCVGLSGCLSVYRSLSLSLSLSLALYLSLSLLCKECENANSLSSSRSSLT
jgi:hypothetical protein